MQLMKISAEGGAAGARWLLERVTDSKKGANEQKKKSSEYVNGSSVEIGNIVL
ncbi:MAG: hypothetical protein UY48_C0010G0025 [Candidatus Gottesmanbacteria bacterium GW2011_GWB1_49_7]|uniref:Uncharacterized protein n=1 Tax=Candidatus Gottesmanbacteria bacterium GW2011_GWB1_49_7 TaxID=1618448 RepID=A0A0G1W1U6_9BACT|nr:MAG: hypothetical protein UY48_C0010G0025 [Candidatus Gottesmanbacteria bacterium GW2011_GWB1_49_7]